MSILKKFNSYFINDDDIDLSRRKVIKTAGALAALTIIGAVTPKLLKAATLTIQEQINTGLVQNQTFYLTEPIIINIPNVVVRNCYFEAMNHMRYMVEIGGLAHHTVFQNCSFKSRRLVDFCIKINPQSVDMTTVFQSAIDAASNSDIKSIHLPNSWYKI